VPCPSVVAAAFVPNHGHGAQYSMACEAHVVNDLLTDHTGPAFVMLCRLRASSASAHHDSPPANSHACLCRFSTTRPASELGHWMTRPNFSRSDSFDRFSRYHVMDVVQCFKTIGTVFLTPS
jgi:hypothetical protein